MTKNVSELKNVLNIQVHEENFEFPLNHFSD